MLHTFIDLSPRSYKYPTGEARKCFNAHTGTARDEKVQQWWRLHPAERALPHRLKDDIVDGKL